MRKTRRPLILYVNAECRNSGKKVSPASAFKPVVNCVNPASAFRHQAQSDTADHGLVRHCLALVEMNSRECICEHCNFARDGNRLKRSVRAAPLPSLG
jgi:hypothetical protein